MDLDSIKKNDSVSNIKEGDENKRQDNKKLMSDISNKIQNKNILNILEFLKNKNYQFFNSIFIDEKNIDKKTFVKESLDDFIKRQILNFLKYRLEDLKSEISFLRKSGKDVEYLSLKVISVPLKIKIFEASFESKDFFKVTELLDFCEEELKKIKEGIKNSSG
ncbi:MAG: hypothetical protein QXW97_04640 [Candidatus Pacearchaeota archaeon]